MTLRFKVFFWVALAALVFSFFLWLFRIAIPEIALQFSLGTTLVLVSGLLAGHLLTSISLRTNVIANVRRTIYLAVAVVLSGFVAMAYLLNSMIENTTLFSFALTTLIFFLVNAAAACLVTIIRHQYKRTLVSAQASLAQSRSELQLLQSQLSPHFLFNTLNNLYGLSLTDPGRVPPLLLKLSELLRYSVYDVKDVFIPLQHEVDYISNYVEFERLRLGDRLRLRVDFPLPKDLECKIPPLLLIVFVENAFKHSRAAGEDPIDIDIALRKTGNLIVFSVSNSCAPGSRERMNSEKHSGFGLNSVKKRLDLLYAGRHKLMIDQTQGKYKVQLELECQ